MIPAMRGEAKFLGRSEGDDSGPPRGESTGNGTPKARGRPGVASRHQRIIRRPGWCGDGGMMSPNFALYQVPKAGEIGLAATARVVHSVGR